MLVPQSLSQCLNWGTDCLPACLLSRNHSIDNVCDEFRFRNDLGWIVESGETRDVVTECAFRLKSQETEYRWRTGRSASYLTRSLSESSISDQWLADDIQCENPSA